MISPAEVRIGNYVIDPHGRTMEIEIGRIRDTHYVPYYWKDIHPIPLTEDWLIKFGFEEVDYSQDGISKLLCYEKNIILEKFIEAWFLCDHSFENVRPIEYVHQLQNLYFALIGEELICRAE